MSVYMFESDFALLSPPSGAMHPFKPSTLLTSLKKHMEYLKTIPLKTHMGLPLIIVAFIIHSFHCFFFFSCSSSAFPPSVHLSALSGTSSATKLSTSVKTYRDGTVTLLCLGTSIYTHTPTPMHQPPHTHTHSHTHPQPHTHTAVKENLPKIHWNIKMWFFKNTFMLTHV